MYSFIYIKEKHAKLSHVLLRGELRGESMSGKEKDKGLIEPQFRRQSSEEGGARTGGWGLCVLALKPGGRFTDVLLVCVSHMLEILFCI